MKNFPLSPMRLEYCTQFAKGNFFDIFDYFEMSCPCNIFLFIRFRETFVLDNWVLNWLLRIHCWSKFLQVYWDNMRKIIFHLEFRVDTSLLLDLVSDKYIVRKWFETYVLRRYQKYSLISETQLNTPYNNHIIQSLSLQESYLNDEVVIWSPISINIIILL